MLKSVNLVSTDFRGNGSQQVLDSHFNAEASQSRRRLSSSPRTRLLKVLTSGARPRLESNLFKFTSNFEKGPRPQVSLGVQ